MAYTLTDDHNAQRKVCKAHGNHHYGNTIKTAAYGEADSKLARFVGLAAAYEKAGGKTPAISSAKVNTWTTPGSCRSSPMKSLPPRRKS
jgi:hypothetical protein